MNWTRIRVPARMTRRPGRRHWHHDSAIPGESDIMMIMTVAQMTRMSLAPPGRRRAVTVTTHGVGGDHAASDAAIGRGPPQPKRPALMAARPHGHVRVIMVTDHQ